MAKAKDKITHFDLPAMSVGGILKFDDVLDLFESFERQNQLLVRMDMSAAVFRKFRAFGRQALDEVTRKELLKQGFFATMFTADIHVDNTVGPNKIRCHTTPFGSVSAQKQERANRIRAKKMVATPAWDEQTR